MRSSDQVFLRLKEKVVLEGSDRVLLGDLASIWAEEEVREKLENLIYPIETEGKNNILISAMSLISLVKKNMPHIDLVIMGKDDILLNFVDKRGAKDRYKILRLILVCFLLFIGSITAIINFHSDVDMKESHRLIHRAITGVETDKLLWLQIPYALGIGVGMAVFFNNVFNKKITNEPTPLDMEIHSYQENVDRYIKNNGLGE